MNRCVVTVSYAQSLDGRIATRTGDSQWIGGPESATWAHQLRHENQAILVGIQTVLRDDPLLTCRLPGGRNPIRVILDSQLRLPLAGKLVQTLHQAPLWVYCLPQAPASKRQQLQDLGVRVVPISALSESLDLKAVLADLSQRGVHSLFVEGGGAVITSFLKDHLVDRLVVITAPLLIGKGVEAIGDLEIASLAAAQRPQQWKRWEMGSDLATEFIF